MVGQQEHDPSARTHKLPGILEPAVLTKPQTSPARLSLPATVDIKQTKVKVGKGSFKAMMTIPEGYTFGNKKDISAAVSEGASAKRIALK